MTGEAPRAPQRSLGDRDDFPEWMAQITAALDAYAAPTEETSVVRGYKVKVSRTVVGADEARDRRAAIARVVAGSLRALPRDE